MSILINKDTKVITQGITGKTGQFHTEKCQEYANGKNCFVAGVNPKKAGESIFGIPIFSSVKEAAKETGATVSVIYVPPAGAAAAIWEAVEADLDLAYASPKAFRCATCSKCAIACAPAWRLAARKPCCWGPIARA